MRIAYATIHKLDSAILVELASLSLSISRPLLLFLPEGYKQIIGSRYKI